MLLKTLRRSELDRVLNQRHVNPSLPRRPPRRTGVGRTNVAPVQLFDERLVEHRQRLAGGDGLDHLLRRVGH